MQRYNPSQYAQLFRSLVTFRMLYAPRWEALEDRPIDDKERALNGHTKKSSPMLLVKLEVRDTEATRDLDTSRQHSFFIFSPVTRPYPISSVSPLLPLLVHCEVNPCEAFVWPCLVQKSVAKEFISLSSRRVGGR